MLDHMAVWTKERELAQFREAMSAGWQPIETAPKDVTAALGNHVLLWPGVIDATEPMIGTLHEDGTWRDHAGDWELKPTHWMPLPEPPYVDELELGEASASGSSVADGITTTK